MTTPQPPPEPTPWGTRRRLQALMTRGWSPQALQAAAGLPAAHITIAVLNSRKPVPVLDDRHVAAAYDQLWQQPPPETTARERRLAAQARQTAAERSWAPPMAWDDDLIDQPAAAPAAGWKPARTSRKAADLIEDLDWIRQQGGYRHATTAIAAARLGIKPDTLDQALRRHARRQAEPELEAG